MPRELRPRKTRQRYTDLSLDEDRDEQEPGPSQPRPTVQEDRGNTTDNDDGDRGSNFAPPALEEIALSEEEGSDRQGARRASVSGSEADFQTKRSNKKKRSAGPSKTTAKTKAKAKGKGKATVKGKDKDKEKEKKAAAPAPTLVPPASARQNHTLPNPNVHHRHRPVPLFSLAASALRVERLLFAPRLFAPNELVPTLAYASSPALTRRVGKAWGACVGAGPAWPIVEDLGWFRESAANAEEDGTKVLLLLHAERARRPRVHVGVGDRAPLPLLRAECVFSTSPPPGCRLFFLTPFLCVSETGSRTCQLNAPQISRVPLPRQCLVTLARLGDRPTSSSRRSKRRNCVGSHAHPD
jgi:transcription factor C subunit 6